MYQYVKRGVVHPFCIPSGENVADVLTKAVVPKKLFFEFTDMMFGNGETYEEFIVKLIRKNFSKYRNDKVPNMEEYIKGWLSQNYSKGLVSNQNASQDEWSFFRSRKRWNFLAHYSWHCKSQGLGDALTVDCANCCMNVYDQGGLYGGR